jgi:hypothetical protein
MKKLGLFFVVNMLIICGKAQYATRLETNADLNSIVTVSNNFNFGIISFIIILGNF